jgi:hypothetical protein
MHTYIHTYMHTYIHTYIHTYLHTHIHTYILTYLLTHTHTHTHTHTQAVWSATEVLGNVAAALNGGSKRQIENEIKIQLKMKRLSFEWRQQDAGTSRRDIYGVIFIYQMLFTYI